MTAIVSAFIPNQGFVVAADSRQTEDETLKPIRDGVQKLHFAKHPDCDLVFGWAGLVNGDTTLCGTFDFNKVTMSVVGMLAAKRFNCWGDFVQKICDGVYWTFGACTGGQIFPAGSNRPDKINHVLLVGYFRSSPVLATVKIKHNRGFLCPPEVELLETGKENNPSEIVMFDGLQDVFNEKITESPETLAEAIEAAKSYIDACKTRSDYYGGKTSVVQLTPSGFVVIESPE